MLTAYFDESGIHKDSSATVIGGFLATNETWEKIQRDWQKHLDDFHVPYFHLAALESGFKPLDKLPRALRYALYRNLINVLLAHKPTPIATALINVDWHKLDRNNPAAAPFFARYIEPYDYCFDATTQFLITHSQQFYGGEPIDLVFSEQLEYQSRSFFVYNAYGRNPYWKDKFASLKYASMKKVQPLQCADIMAYDTYQNVLQFIKTRKQVPIDGLVKEFFDNGMQPYARYTDEKGLQEVIAQGPKWTFPLDQT